MEAGVIEGVTVPLLHSGFSVKHASLHVVVADAMAARRVRRIKLSMSVVLIGRW